MPVGGTAPVRAVVRLVAATNKDIERMMAQGLFRKDLYYRLNVIPLRIPPLRERPEDIVPIARHILAAVAEEVQTLEYRLSPAAEDLLARHHWPGNVRELRNVLLRALYALDGDTIGEADLAPCLADGAAAATPGGGRGRLREERDQAEKDAILRALAATGRNKARAAALLGVDRAQLYRKLRKHGLS